MLQSWVIYLSEILIRINNLRITSRVEDTLCTIFYFRTLSKQDDPNKRMKGVKFSNRFVKHRTVEQRIELEDLTGNKA